MTRVQIFSDFVKAAGLGGKGTLPLEGTPTVVKTEPWDGKDGEIIEEDEFSLEELMGDSTAEKDEFYVWAAAGKQPELEKHVGVGGYGYPALIALNIKKGAYAPLKGAFE
nr:protein disulfide isomerase-like 2-3 [Tanacetum cinerariifolium]